MTMVILFCLFLQVYHEMVIVIFWWGSFSRRRLRDDRRAEPRVGERVPYVVVYGSPGLPLIKLVRQPLEVVQDCTLRINVTYYIQKLILPCLDRMLGLIGANVFSWYEDLPRVHRVAPHGQPLHPDTKQVNVVQESKTFYSLTLKLWCIIFVCLMPFHLAQ